jgi:outer membrane protein OmpA-like peptidoglycan-associated protein
MVIKKKTLSMKTILISFLCTVSGLTSAQQTTPLKVLVLNEIGKPYEGDKIFFVGQTKKDSHSGITNAQGTFTIDLPTGQVYDIRIKSIGEEIEYNELEIPTLEEGQRFQDVVLTITYEAPKTFTLTSIQFETGKAELKKESYPILEDLLELMTLKPKMKIQISGHTDSDGDEAANLLLSQQRADAVKKYLVSKGISTTRISAIGYGETKPVADNSTTEGKAKNRRTEIKIL